MDRLMEVSDRPSLKIGMGGNYYVICTQEQPLHKVCEAIGKSTKSIYYNERYRCFAIRVKNDKQKKLLLNYNY